MYLIPNGHFKGEEYITVPGGVQVKRAARVSVNAAPVFGGTSTTGTAVSGGDYVDVR
ncbi:hypothetical protein ACWFR5_17255 [Streptomyces sp. NPDC055092]